MRLASLLLSSLFCSVLALGCEVSTGAKSSIEDPVLAATDGSADSFTRRLEVRGTISYGQTVTGAYSTTGYAGWLFTAAAGARVSIDLVGSGNDPVLYLYGPERAGGWAWRSPLARNDDSDGTLNSRIERRLRFGGTYLLLAREYWGRPGSFSLTLACTGSECRPECGADDSCPVGSDCHRVYCFRAPCPSFCEPIDPVTACEVDSDCVAVEATCCPCSMGGHTRAVNASYADAVAPVCGPDPIACPAVYMCVPERPACVEGACQMQPLPEGECAPEACGPALGMPNWLCEDGTTWAGPTGRCLRHEDGSCGWEIAQCPPVEQACGSRGLGPCADGEFCDFPASAACGSADAPGVCHVRPTACTREFDPVCGCDGRTYPNGCNANAAGISIAHRGACEPPPPVCHIGGCSGQLCVGEGMPDITTCEWRAEYACYRAATCEAQPGGTCGWTPTPELTACLEAAGNP